MGRSTARKDATIAPLSATIVGVRDLRDHVSAYLERVKAGEVVTITEHGPPVATLVSRLPSAHVLELAREGRVTPATKPRTPLAAWDMRLRTPASAAGLAILPVSI
jgi:prevent-host-death family protein